MSGKEAPCKKHLVAIIALAAIIIIWLLHRFFRHSNIIGTAGYYWDEAKAEWRKIERDLGLNGVGQRTCLSREAQNKIANEINQKLREINACDCTTTCALMASGAAAPGTQAPGAAGWLYGTQNGTPSQNGTQISPAQPYQSPFTQGPLVF